MSRILDFNFVGTSVSGLDSKRMSLSKEKTNNSQETLMDTNNLFASLFQENIRIDTNMNLFKNLKIDNNLNSPNKSTLNSSYDSRNSLLNLKYQSMEEKMQHYHHEYEDYHSSISSSKINNPKMENLDITKEALKPNEEVSGKNTAFSKQLEENKLNSKEGTPLNDLALLNKLKQELAVDEKIPEGLMFKDKKVNVNSKSNTVMSSDLDGQTNTDSKNSQENVSDKQENRARGTFENFIKRTQEREAHHSLGSNVNNKNLNHEVSNRKKLLHSKMNNKTNIENANMNLDPIKNNVSRETLLNLSQNKSIEKPININQNANFNITASSQENSIGNLLKNKLKSLGKTQEAKQQITEQFQAMMKKSKLLIKDNNNVTLTANLHPKELGKISLSLRLLDGQLQGSFLVDNDFVQKELINKLDRMVTEMSNEGYKDPKFNVDVHSGRSNQGFHQEFKKKNSMNKLHDSSKANVDDINYENNTILSEKELLYA